MTNNQNADLISQRLGFGCGRLKGGIDKSNSLRIIHAALDLGIRHFDTAPPYGLGASEPVLGDALKGVQETVTICTKAGLARPDSPGLMQVARSIVKPLANRLPGMRKYLLKGMAKRASSGQFDPEFIAQSLETSLRLLKRDRIDILLLHEPLQEDNLLPLIDVLNKYTETGQIGIYGSSTGEAMDSLVKFGSVWQYRSPEPWRAQGPFRSDDILHGAFRYVAPFISDAMNRNSELKDQLASLLPSNLNPVDCSGALAVAYILSHYDNRLIISTNHNHRLTSMIEQVRHIAAQANWVSSMHALNLTMGEVH